MNLTHQRLQKKKHGYNPFGTLIIYPSLPYLSFNNIDDGISLIYPQLVNWDQQGPPILDIFGNDEAIAEFMGLREEIPQGDHKVCFTIDLDTATYFNETIPPSSHKSDKNKIKNDSL